MKNNLSLFAAVCAVCVFCISSVNARSVLENPAPAVASEAITITPDNNTSLYWDSSLGAYRVRYNTGSFMRFNISVQGASSFQIMLNPWSYNSSWSPGDNNWMFNHPAFTMQGFQYYSPGGSVFYQANSQTTYIGGSSIVMEFSIPMNSSGYRTGSFTVQAGSAQKTISFVQSTY